MWCAADGTPRVMPRAYRMRARADAALATRSRIAKAAWQRFAREPFDVVTLADVARDARVSTRTVLNQFGTKEDLFVAAFSDMAARGEASRSHLEPSSDPLAVAQAVCEAYEDRGDALLLLEAQEDRIPAVREMTEFSRERHRALVRRLSQPLLCSLDPGVAERRVAQLIAVTDLHFWHRLRRREGLSAEETRRAIAEAILAITRLDDA